jgi:DNA-binding transcriptional ArsR family regulator
MGCVVVDSRPVISDADALQALAHPVRLDVLNYLMSQGPATASVCARAVGDSPSNCSYHLRVLARHKLVEAGQSDDGRERPWRAAVTGFSVADADPGTAAARGGAALRAASLQLDQRLSREYLARRDRVAARWRTADAYRTYTLRATPQELRELVDKLDKLIRPLIAATRTDAPKQASMVHMSLQAFPRESAS